MVKFYCLVPQKREIRKNQEKNFQFFLRKFFYNTYLQGSTSIARCSSWSSIEIYMGILGNSHIQYLQNPKNQKLKKKFQFFLRKFFYNTHLQGSTSIARCVSWSSIEIYMGILGNSQIQYLKNPKNQKLIKKNFYEKKIFMKKKNFMKKKIFIKKNLMKKKLETEIKKNNSTVLKKLSSFYACPRGGGPPHSF